MGGGSGGGGGKIKITPSPLEQTQADIANKQQARTEMLNTEFTDPMRQFMMPQIMQALGQNPFSTSLSAAQRAPYESQFNQAKRQLMDTAAPGGMLRSQMAGLERDRAGAIADAANQQRQLGIGRALQVGMGQLPNVASEQQGTQTALSGLASANQSASQRALQQAQLQAQQQQAKGGGIGSLIGGGLGMLGKP